MTKKRNKNNKHNFTKDDAGAGGMWCFLQGSGAYATCVNSLLLDAPWGSSRPMVALRFVFQPPSVLSTFSRL